MLDLDDLAHLPRYDRRNLLARAAAVGHVAGGAAAALQFLSTQQPSRNAPITLAVPAGVAGIAQTSVAVRSTQAPTLFVSSRRPATPAAQRSATVLDLFDVLSVDDHPLFTFGFFQGLCAGLAGPTTPAPALQLDRRWLESCHPSIPAAANPAKQIALHLYAHVALVWADMEAFAGVAADWQSRLLLYAETAAIFATVDEMRGLWSMARFPNFWANGVRGVELTTGTAAASDRLHMLLQRRRIKTMRIAAPGASPAALCAHLLALGEWVALYAARLYQVDPADRVPLAYLGLE